MTRDNRTRAAVAGPLGVGLAAGPGAAEPVRPRLSFEPALEGLRGFALVGMLCFHSQFEWAVGGFLPIATFFTLSGYLITSLFLVEWESNGTIRLGRFWMRRFRRLMPASLLTLAAMSVFAVYLASPDQLRRLRPDVLWALFYAANWHFVLTDAAYQDLFSAPSPVHHFWSLAIEEQFYLVFPLIAFAGLRLAGGSRAVFATLLGLVAAASVLVSVWLIDSGASLDRVYYGSDTRAAELLLGGVLAIVLQGRPPLRGAGRWVAEGLGLCAIALMLYLWHTVHLSERWLYVGGFAAYTSLSVAVIVAAVQPSGGVRALLSAAPIRWIGRVSYGAYLFHWPIYLWLSADYTGLATLPLFAVRMFVTFALAGLSYRFLESPIRTGRFLTGWRPRVVVPAAFAAVAVAISAATAAPPDRNDLSHPDVQALVQLLDSYDAAPPDRDEAPGLGKSKPRVAVFGDSTATFLSVGLGIWSQKEGRARVRRGVAEPGCGLARKGTYRTKTTAMLRPNHCQERGASWTKQIEQGRPDIAVVLIGPWDVCDRLLPGDDTWRGLGDPILDAYMQEEMLDAVDILSAEGTLVLWLTHPLIEARDQGKPPASPYPESNPDRMHRFNELIQGLEKQRPGKVLAVDLAEYLRSMPGGELDPAYRPDGTHLTIESSVRVSYDWLGGEILRVYRAVGNDADRPE